jgi:predicted nucleotidyltransferase
LLKGDVVNLNLEESEGIGHYTELLSQLKDLISKNLNNIHEIESIILFGSYATRTYNEESDIDICILFNKGANRELEDIAFNYFLDLGKSIDKNIQCLFIYPEDIHHFDRILLEDILTEGKLLYGTNSYYSLFFQMLDLEPYHLITMDLKNINIPEKMKLKRLLYGYQSSKRYSDKIYTYSKKGFLQKHDGIKLGRGSFVIPEKKAHLIEEQLNSFQVQFSRLRIWMQKI